MKTQIAMISDRDHIIAISGGSKKDYMEKRISPELEKLIEGRTTYLTSEEENPIKIIYEESDQEEYDSQVISPIVMQGDPIGSVILISKDKDSIIGEVELTVVGVASAFLSKQMEN